MKCIGTFKKQGLDNGTKFVNEDRVEVFYGYRNDFAPLKMIISGCGGKYNYIGETRQSGSELEFILTENDTTILRIVKATGVAPKCDIVDCDRELEIKRSFGLGFLRSTVIENDIELAVITIKRNDYTLEVKDDENPTLMTTILMGAAEVNGFSRG